MDKDTQHQSIHYIHRMNYSTQEKLVGIFVLLALLVFFLLFAMNSKTTHLFDDYISLHLYVKNAEGISSETAVRISGIEVGKVAQVEIAPDNRIRITVRVYERYHSLLRQDSSAAIGKLSLLGRSSIDITAGSPELPGLEDGTALIVEEPLSFDQLIAELTPVIRGIEESVENFALVMAAIEPDKLNNTLNNLQLASEQVEQISRRLASGKGALGMAMYDDTFQQQLGNAVGTLESALYAAERRLQQLDPVLANMDSITRQTDQAATHFPLLVDETTQMVSNVNTSLTSLNMEIKQLPDLITRMNVLMEQTDRLLEGIANSWMFSSPDNPQQGQLIGVQPSHD